MNINLIDQELLDDCDVWVEACRECGVGDNHGELYCITCAD